MSRNNARAKKVQKDMVLMVPLLILNLVSGYTTIAGARLALGDAGIAVIAGITIQSILFILLSGSAARHAPGRKWIAVLVFSVFSIYTSFFTYHSSFISEDQMAGAIVVQAEESHRQLMDYAATPFLQDYKTLLSEYEILSEQVENEKTGVGGTGISGFGPEARRLEAESSNLKTQLLAIEDAAAKVEEGSEKFNALNPKEPESILSIDQAIWTALPIKYHQNENGYSGFDRNDYFNQDERFALLAPILTLTSSEKSASRASSMAALLIAGMIDGVSILLGTAIEVRSKRTPFEGIAISLSRLIWGFKQAVKTVGYYWKKQGSRHPIPSGSELDIAREAVYLVQLKLNNRGSDFLTNFFNAVDPIDKTIDYSQLNKQSEPTMRTGYRLLIEAFRHPSLNWVKASSNNTQWMFSDLDSYVDFCRWLSDEIVHQAEIESKESNYHQALSPSRVVKIRRPQAA